MDPLNFQSVWANHILVCCNCPQMLQDMEAGEDDMEDDADWAIYAHPKLRATMFETIVSQKISCAMARVTWLQQISIISLYLLCIDCVETKLRLMWSLSPGAVIQNHNETPQLQRWLFGAQTLGVSNMGPFPMTMQNNKRRDKAANVGIKKRWKAADGHQDQIIRWWFFRSNSDNLNIRRQKQPNIRLCLEAKTNS